MRELPKARFVKMTDPMPIKYLELNFRMKGREGDKFFIQVSDDKKQWKTIHTKVRAKGQKTGSLLVKNLQERFIRVTKDKP